VSALTFLELLLTTTFDIVVYIDLRRDLIDYRRSEFDFDTSCSTHLPSLPLQRFHQSSESISRVHEHSLRRRDVRGLNTLFTLAFGDWKWRINSFTFTVAIWVQLQSIKGWVSECPDVKNYKLAA